MRKLATFAAAATVSAGLILSAHAQSSNDANTSRAPGSGVTTPSPATNGMSTGGNGGGTPNQPGKSGTMSPPNNGPRIGPNGTSDVPPDQSRTGTGRGQ
jgi:hypothetical protein